MAFPEKYLYNITDKTYGTEVPYESESYCVFNHALSM